MMGQFKLKFEIGEIEFEAEGSYEEVEKERKIFVEQILPLVAKIKVPECEEPCCDNGIKALKETVIVAPTIVEDKKKQVTKKKSKK